MEKIYENEKNGKFTYGNAFDAADGDMRFFRHDICRWQGKHCHCCGRIV